MRPVLTPAEMAEADRRTIEAGTPVEVLMERAGRHVAWAVRDRTGTCYGTRAVIVCGKGNNGGDGLVAGRVLRGWGVQVEVQRLEDGIDRARCERALRRADVAVDAMFGTGFKGALEGDAAWVADALRAAAVPTIAVDIPSGVDGLTGAVSGTAVAAERTVAFAALKPGLVQEPGRGHAGRVDVVDIGVDIGVEARAPSLFVTERTDVAEWLPVRATSTNKWAVGATMVVGGSAGMIGAPLLASHAALRAGAGMVRCGVPGVEAAEAGSGTEVITKVLPSTLGGALDETAAAPVLDALERFGALVVGPGLGGDERTRAAVGKLIADAPVPVVIDADGLNALARDPAPLRRRHDAGLPPAVLTPHEGEFARVAGSPPGPDRMQAARILAERTYAVVVLKGPATIVAAPDGRTAVNPTGGPWLATAGTGDVLSGIVGAFLARGVPTFEAAAGAAWVHGRAADHAGHEGLVAGDLVPALRPTLEELHSDEGE
jgi:ADP-dependent NAD(P)H-hydrate dehydratase / NAD(P)H-hydrate epimerase